MTLLAPWFLLGVLAIAGPVIAHLRRLHVQKRVAFSAVDLLEPRPPRSARRSWEDLALMAARIAVLALLSFAFARPYLPLGVVDASLKTDEKRWVVLLDTSASMRRGKVFEEARRVVLEKVRLGGMPDALEIRTFDRGVRTVLSFTQWVQTARADRERLLNQVLSSIVPGWAAARLDEALRSVAEEHAAQGGGNSTEVLLVSDFQEGSSIAGLQGYEWPQRFSITACKVGSPNTEGVALRWLPPDLDSAPSDTPCRLQIVTSPDFRAETVSLVVEGTGQLPSSFAVGAGKSKVVSFPHNAAFNRVRVEGSEDIGASAWVARVPQSRTLVVVASVAGSSNDAGTGEGENKTAALYFVRSALQALGEARVELAEGGALPLARDPEVALWVVCGKGEQALEERMRASIERGATALVLLGSTSETPALSALSGISITAKESERANGSFAVLGAIEREHPLFAPFLSPQFSDFTAIRFWKHRVLDFPATEAARVLARFEGGDPAILEIRRGQGKVLAWSSDWKPADGQWVLSSRCVPFLAACVELAGGGRRPLLTGSPGESFTLSPGATAVRNEAAERLPVSNGSVVLERPGVYQIEPGGGTIVVNIAPEEASFASLPVGKLGALGVPLNQHSLQEGAGATGTAAAESLALGELETRQGAWRFVLAGVLGLVVLETVWAARITQKRKGIA